MVIVLCHGFVESTPCTIDTEIFTALESSHSISTIAELEAKCSGLFNQLHLLELETLRTGKKL